ncbi:MAG TPA: 2Fe-2S iron-sulfur cluster-binding protein [Thermoplasmata archaeon]|nr:2Fe-2S iron-sulfur cluster-binding protein [Thermoplasmata archaeon]
MSRAWRGTVNGRPVERGDIPDDERLLDTLRWRLGLKGTKEGCRSGDCGACTVLVSDRSTLSCLALTHEVDGERIVTIEGAEGDAVVAKVQAAFASAQAVQCGYCTPGFVLALAGLLKERPPATPASELLEDLQGNLCRCTGYAAIQRAVRSLTTEGT